MARTTGQSVANFFAEHLMDTWKLLSETSSFIARTPEFPQYEEQLRAWRLNLQSNATDVDLNHAIRDEIVQLRKNLRMQGYDLSLASKELVFEGFRNDASLREGFMRMVLFLGDSEVYYITGEENHIALAEYLDARVNSLTHDCIRERHYLWYQWRGKTLVLSGADTESKEDFERLLKIGEANNLRLLGKLKGLK